jgi:hypothetical protein
LDEAHYLVRDACAPGALPVAFAGMTRAFAMAIAARFRVERSPGQVTFLNPPSLSKSSAAPLPVPRTKVAWIKLPDGAVLFSPETEVYYGMNSVAAAIWELLPFPGGTMELLCDAIMERFPDATASEVRADVEDLIQDLERSGLVDHVECPPAA